MAARELAMSLPDLESLRCFVAVARLLHFGAAAKSVHLSGTAFSERIRKLEQDLGQPLLERSTRHVALTIAGRRLVPHALQLLQDASRLVTVVGDAAQTPPFSLTVGTRFELGLSWLVPALQPLQLARPERTVHLRFGDSPEMLAAVQAGGMDGAVTSLRCNAAGLQCAPLHQEDYDLVASPAVAPLVGAADAPCHTLLDTLPDQPLFRYLLDALPPGAVWQFARAEHLGTIAAVRYRALQGAGVAVLPRYFVADDLAQGRLERLMPEVVLASDRFRLWWRGDHPLRAELAELAASLQALPLQ